MRVALIIAAAFAVAFPATASASHHPKHHPYIPPGNSGANQYVESIPTAGGSNSTGDVISTAPVASLPSATLSALRHQGADGRATLRLAETTAPPTLSRAAKVQGGVPASAASPSPSSPVGAVVRSLFGVGDGGIALPVILILLALAMVAERLRRRRV